MNKIDSFTRLIQIRTELLFFKRYFHRLTELIPEIVSEEFQENRLGDFIRVYTPKQDQGLLGLIQSLQARREIIEQDVNRFFLCSQVPILYAILEAGIYDIAKILRYRLDIGLGIRDIRGDSLERARKYFEHVLHFPLQVDSKSWERIRILVTVRHFIVHNNGRLELLEEESRKKIERIAEKKIGVSIGHRPKVVVIEPHFLSETTSVVEKTFDNLAGRILQTYPDMIPEVPQKESGEVDA